MNPALSVNATTRPPNDQVSRRISRFYLFLVIAMTGIALIYGYWRGEVTEQEARYFLATRSVDSLPTTNLVLERSISVAIGVMMTSLLAIAMRRAHGWCGVGAMLAGLASSPVLIYLASSATPDIGLVGLASVMFVRLLSQPSARAAVLGGMLLLFVGMTIHADLVLGGGYLTALVRELDPLGWATSVVAVAIGTFTVVTSWFIGVTVEAWNKGKLNAQDSRLLHQGGAALVIAVPVLCIAIGSIRLMTVFQYLERVDITLAFAWIAFSIAVAQVWLRMPVAHFFPILLTVLAAKVTWVHALGQERDLRQGSAVVARAVADAVNDRGPVLIDAKVDNVFRYTLYHESARTPESLAANPWLVTVADRDEMSMSGSQVAGRFRLADGRAIELLRAGIPIQSHRSTDSLR